MLKNYKVEHRQKGFTLVEIAIVLVIIGLLLGGVLKGQELINSAKVKNMANDFRTVSTFVYAYQDRFRALPGDDRIAVTHLGATAGQAAVATAGNGRINGAWDAPRLAANAALESYLFWQHVRLANLASGSTTIGAADYAYTNADGGIVGVTGEPVIADNSWPASYYVCSDNIQGRYARQIDTTIDDGNTTTGSVRVIGANATASVLNQAALPPNLLPATDAALYTVCVAY